MNVIILTHDVREPGSLTGFGNPVSFAVATTANQLPGRLAPGSWRIVRRDLWQFDERVVSALHMLASFPGVELIDPTGLLGGSLYGAERNSIGTEPVPFGQGAAGAKVRTTKRSRIDAGDGTERSWR